MISAPDLEAALNCAESQVARRQGSSPAGSLVSSQQDAEEALGLSVSIGAALGPPLEFLPKDIEPCDLQAYRTDYQAFRAGCATGARGEISSLSPAAGEPAAVAWSNFCRGSYVGRSWRRNTARFVPLIGLKIQESSACLSAFSAASEHHQELSELLQESEEEELPAATLTSTPVASPRRCPSPGENAAHWTALAEPQAPDQPQPLRRHAVTSQQGVGLLVHILGSLACLLPCLLVPFPHWCCGLGLPASYALAVLAATMRTAAREATERGAGCLGLVGASWNQLLARVLRMERLIREACVPQWFPSLSAAMYGLIAVQLSLGRTFSSSGGSRRISLWNATPQRHQYNCWGSDQGDVADCVLVRHAACTMLVSFYVCLAVVAVCNRNVKGLKIVHLHRQSLLSLFPQEAPCLFSYVERSVDSNSAFWRTNRRYHFQSVATSLAWTFISFWVYAGLLQDAESVLARAVFLGAVPCTYALQFTLMRHVLLRVMLHLEAVKSRAAAIAYCDEEGVLPFTSAHAIYVWFSVRRNVQAQNEAEYQHALPIFAASLLCAVSCCCWVATQLIRQGLSVFALTSRGGASLMVVATACFSCVFVWVVLGTLSDIGRLEEAHARQLRVAHLRLEHARGQRWPGQEGLQGAVDMLEKVILFLEHHDQRVSIFGVEIGSKSFQVVSTALLSNIWYLLVWGVLIPLIGSDGGKDE